MNETLRNTLNCLDTTMRGVELIKEKNQNADVDMIYSMLHSARMSLEQLSEKF